jgi:hypothetical protein
MIVLARTLAKTGAIARDDLMAMCGPIHIPGANEPDFAKLRIALARWLELSLFSEQEGKIGLNFAPERGETLDAFTERLPGLCRALVLRPEHTLPLWPVEPKRGDYRTDEGTGRAADFARPLSWILAQDIYSLPSSWNEISELEKGQVKEPKFIIFNASRWSGLRFWARYLGFCTGEDKKFFADTTSAVRQELPSILKKGEAIAADAFIDALAERLPVLDRGAYRMMVEAEIQPNSRRELPTDHLSMSLSFALRRLELDGALVLDKKADAGTTLALTGRGYRTWARFTHVRLLGDE